MITFQKSADRRYIRDGAMEMWQTFEPANPAGPLRQGRESFRSLESLNELSLTPGTGFKLLLDEDHEVMTYVRKGGIMVRNRPEGDELLGAGSFNAPARIPG